MSKGGGFEQWGQMVYNGGNERKGAAVVEDMIARFLGRIAHTFRQDADWYRRRPERGGEG